MIYNMMQYSELKVEIAKLTNELNKLRMKNQELQVRLEMLTKDFNQKLDVLCDFLGVEIRNEIRKPESITYTLRQKR